MAKVDTFIAHMSICHLKRSSGVISDRENQYGMSNSYQNISAKYWMFTSAWSAVLHLEKLSFD